MGTDARKTGRPAKRLRQADYQTVVELAKLGCADHTIAKALGLHPRGAWANRKKDDPALEAALAEGRAIEHDALVSKLREAADSGNIVAAIFLLKARHGYRDQGPTDTTTVVGVQIQLPAALSPDGYQRLIEERKDAPHGTDAQTV